MMLTIETSCPPFLIEAARLVEKNNIDDAVVLLESFEPEDDISTVCAEFLKTRGKELPPLYLANFDQIDLKQINVFDLILKSVPMVQLVNEAAIDALMELYTRPLDSFTHLNIGIGKGIFEARLLHALAEQDAPLPSLIRIIGIDIDEHSLHEAERNIRAAAAALPKTTHVECLMICSFAEKIDRKVWHQIINHQTGTLGVISAFTLHHIARIEDRTKVLKNIADCKPGLFVLLEPDVDHFTPDMSQRLINCWNHFGAVFRLIDQSGISKQEADLIKYTFFGREIRDILGNEESKRSEKHEAAQTWAKRLSGLGFAMNTPVPGVEHPLVEIDYHAEAGFTTTLYDGVQLVAMMTATIS